jgi:hypothetical protein
MEFSVSSSVTALAKDVVTAKLLFDYTHTHTHTHTHTLNNFEMSLAQHPGNL